MKVTSSRRPFFLKMTGRRHGPTVARAVRFCLALFVAALAHLTPALNANAQASAIVLGISAPLTGSESAVGSDYLAAGVFGRPISVGEYSVRLTPQDRTGGDFVELTVVDRYGRLIR